MSEVQSPLKVTEVVLRDAHQSLLDARLRLDDMLPIAAKLDRVGFWSVESWGGATFDTCIRYLGEDPWERIRALKEAMPNTRQQMLLRGQNLLGYRHYADDVVSAFVERACANGVEVFRIFDALNDPRNLECAINAVRSVDGHAQGAIAYTVSPVHTLDEWERLAVRLEAMGADSLVIKDMAGLLTPYAAFELVTRLKMRLKIPLSLHGHATTGLSTATALKAIEAGIDGVDTAISSMSMTYGHSPTESLVAAVAGTARDTGLDLALLEEIAAYFREVRKKYSAFEGPLRGVDSRILLAQVPGGMLTSMQRQLDEQGASDRFDEVLAEIPRVRADLGYVPLVTPTSQIVAAQAVMNVLSGERYASLSKEVEALLKGEYGAAPAAYDEALQCRVLGATEAISCRPADLLEPEMERLQDELRATAKKDDIRLAEGEYELDDVLTYALFPQVGLEFLTHRDDPDAFEPAPEAISEQGSDRGKAETDDAAPLDDTHKRSAKPSVYTVTVEGERYVVEVAAGADGSPLAVSANAFTEGSSDARQSNSHHQPGAICAPLSGSVFKINVEIGETVAEGDVVAILEVMKMETEVRAASAGTVSEIRAKEGDSVSVGDTLLVL